LNGFSLGLLERSGAKFERSECELLPINNFHRRPFKDVEFLNPDIGHRSYTLIENAEKTTDAPLITQITWVAHRMPQVYQANIERSTLPQACAIKGGTPEARPVWVLPSSQVSTVEVSLPSESGGLITQRLCRVTLTGW